MKKQENPTKTYPKTIHLSEAVNTWGCHWTELGNEKINYGFSELPPKQSLWLDCVQGDAVEQILTIDGLSEIISTKRGAYGGQKRTISIDVDELESVCAKYWQRANAAGERQLERSQHCHYCGNAPVVGTGFFGESVCQQYSS